MFALIVRDGKNREKHHRRDGFIWILFAFAKQRLSGPVCRVVFFFLSPAIMDVRCRRGDLGALFARDRVRAGPFNIHKHYHTFRDVRLRFCGNSAATAPRAYASPRHSTRPRPARRRRNTATGSRRAVIDHNGRPTVSQCSRWLCPGPCVVCSVGRRRRKKRNIIFYRFIPPAGVYVFAYHNYAHVNIE